MTNCNDGKWHGWDGGEYPVHPESVVEAVFTGSFGTMKDVREAGLHIWGKGTHAFRVVKEYKEPREFWVNVYGDGETYTYTSKESADECADDSRTECIHVREVIE